MKNTNSHFNLFLFAALIIIPFSCKEDNSPTPEGTGLVTTQTPAVLATPVYHGVPQVVNSEDINLASIDDYTEHTFSYASGGIGSIAECKISRVFSKPIKSLKLTIVSGHADDIGYVGSCRVTPKMEGCFGGGSVESLLDVTSNVTISGNSASFVLKGEETCCDCVGGWGEDNLAGSDNARFHWVVKF
ncbi:MAG: hypothetical protein JWN56_2081 [Sphingobacteriales bacterium]|nr:hypothetical protein [Sphingobacteriales bacterium]